MHLLVLGNTGESLPPPYAGIPKSVLLRSREWRLAGAKVAVIFEHQQEGADDLEAGAEYFFEFKQKPTKFKKYLFLGHWFLTHPFLYGSLFLTYWRILGHWHREVILCAAYGVWVKKIYQEWRPDLVIAESTSTRTWMAAEVARRLQLPIVFEAYAEVHDLSMGVNKILTAAEREIYWKDFLGKAQAIIAPSFYCAQGSLQYVPPEKVQVIYHGIDLAVYAAQFSENKNDLRDKFGVPHTAFVMGAVGAFSARKGHDHLIKAAAILARRGLVAAVVLCGPGDPTQWQELARVEGVIDQVYFFSKLAETDLLRLYKIMDVYVDPSNTPRACLGMSLTEAEACGVPCVVYDNGGLTEVVRAGENGWVVPTDDIPALADAIGKIYNLSPTEYQKMSIRGIALAQELVDIKAAAARRLALFRKILS